MLLLHGVAILSIAYDKWYISSVKQLGIKPFMQNVPNGWTHFKNPGANAARFLKCVWPYWDIMHWRVKTQRYFLENLKLASLKNTSPTFIHYWKSEKWKAYIIMCFI